MQWTAIIPMVLLLGSNATFAADGSPAVAVGPLTDCTQFLRSRAGDAEATDLIFGLWTQGYLSGFNSRQAGTGAQTFRDLAAKSLEQQQAWVLQYCKEHPSAQYIEAVMRLYYALPAVPNPTAGQPVLPDVEAQTNR